MGGRRGMIACALACMLWPGLAGGVEPFPMLSGPQSRQAEPGEEARLLDSIKHDSECGIGVNDLWEDNGGTSLHLAAKHGYERLCIVAIRKRANVAATNMYGHAPLHMAARFGHERVALALLAAGASSTVRDVQGVSPLETAAAYGRLDVVKLLVDLGVSIHEKHPRTGYGPLGYAVWFERPKVAKFLLTKGATLNIHTASGLGLPKRVDLMLKFRPKLALSLDALKRSALHWAARNGHSCIVDNLLGRGAPIDQLDSSDRSALALALEFKHFDVAKTLIGHSAKFTLDKGGARSALVAAAGRGESGIVTLLVDNGVDVNGSDDDGRTALHIATYRGHRHIVKFLLGKGARVNAGSHYFTPLQHAVVKGDNEVVKMLLDRGADPNMKESSQGTPLHWAVQRADVPLIRMLVKAGADTKAKDAIGRTPADMAHGDKALSRLLKAPGSERAKKRKATQEEKAH